MIIIYLTPAWQPFQTWHKWTKQLLKHPCSYEQDIRAEKKQLISQGGDVAWPTTNRNSWQQGARSDDVMRYWSYVSVGHELYKQTYTRMTGSQCYVLVVQISCADFVLEFIWLLNLLYSFTLRWKYFKNIFI